ncbi:MAG: acyltransferase, partial [Aquihabitans sp.]
LFLQIYDRYTALGGIVQAWSLCTEISFYLVIPLWAGAVARSTARCTEKGRAVAQLVGCGVLGLGGIASRAAFDRWAPASRGLAFNWLPTNLDLFAAGMAVAVLSVWASSHGGLRARLDRLAQPVWAWWLAATALLAWYAYAVGPADFATGYSGWFWQRRQLVLALFTILLIMPAVFGDQTTGPLRRVWSLRPIVWVGTVSYGLYLWHLDWMERALSGPQGWGWLNGTPGNEKFGAVLVVGLGLGLVCAGISWYLVEQPLQRFKNLIGSGPRSSSGRALGHPTGPR